MSTHSLTQYTLQIKPSKTKRKNCNSNYNNVCIHITHYHHFTFTNYTNYTITKFYTAAGNNKAGALYFFLFTILCAVPIYYTYLTELYAKTTAWFSGVACFSYTLYFHTMYYSTLLSTKTHLHTIYTHPYPLRQCFWHKICFPIFLFFIPYYCLENLQLHVKYNLISSTCHRTQYTAHPFSHTNVV